MTGRNREAWPHGRPTHTGNPTGQRYDRLATRELLFPRVASGNKWRQSILSLLLLSCWAESGGGGAAGGDGEHIASPSSVSSSYLEEVVGSSRPEPASLDAVGGRIIHDIPIFLLKGGIRVDGSPYEPDGDGTVVTEYDWALYIASLYASQYGTRGLLEQRVNRTHIVRDVEDSRLVRAGINLMTTPAPRQSNFMAARKRSGASASAARTRVAPNVPRPPPVRRSSSSGRLPPVLAAQPSPIPQVKVVGGSAPVNRGPGLDPLLGLVTVLVDLSSGAAIASIAPLVRKRKDPAGEGRKDKEGSSSRSASKKSRKGKEKVPSAPLPGGIFSPAFNMSDRTKFHTSSYQRALIEPLFEGELTNAMLEMSTRAASLAWYLKEFADHDYDKKIEQLEADLEKAKSESAEARDRLTIIRGEHERLQEECSQLKTQVSRLRSSEVGLLRTNQALTGDLVKTRERITELEADIEPLALGFDIEKDVFDGVLVDLNSMVDDEELGTEGPFGAAGAAEAMEVEDDDEEDGGDD
ncbi:hypothetical protein LR48_Vigan04g062900 [Vigna angularis]|uniref:Uncharacterized protein n=1 Tax=Phaseolus angularis TaxID=3914 RepID=A0A0L9UCJ0_PHAAN|nr:hypothetical protein LR48_Vigan04g062900 [Vigna angularis]